MSIFGKPTDVLTLNILDLEGNKKEVTLNKEEYFLLNGVTPVLKHDSLIKLSESNGIYIDKTVLEFGAFNDKDNFCFIHRAYKKLKNGSVIDEVGEANPNNLDPGIGGNYPAIMSNKRAQDRLLIRIMGLQGQVYSDAEFGSATESTSAKATEIKSKPSLSLNEAKNLKVDYGKVYSKNPITLGELKEKAPRDFDWLLNTYKVGPNSSEKMKLLHQGAKILARS